ncbi:MAG: spore germination protein, partial [Oscillospiraceae bacterium]|nr:spore germination protein [Oscillospiraceae bacterium]
MNSMRHSVQDSGVDHISVQQWTFTACCFLMGTIMRSGFTNYLMGNESWLIVLTGAIAFIPFMMMYLALARQYPGMNLFEIADASLGKVGGFIVSVLLCVFYVSMATVNLMEVGSFVTAYLIQGTPFLAATLVAALAAAYVLTKGMGALSRLIPAITII